MSLLKLALKNKEVNPESFDELYENMVIRKIRKKYTVNQELAILRQRDDKPAEFAGYHDYVEECKRQVKAELGISKEDQA